jgi:hypothetical protein
MAELSAEMRRRVALACSSAEDFHPYWAWEPERHAFHWKALTQTTARLIKEKYESKQWDEFRYANKLSQFNDALATGDVNAIMALCAELLESEDG